MLNYIIVRNKPCNNVCVVFLLFINVKQRASSIKYKTELAAYPFHQFSNAVLTVEQSKIRICDGKKEPIDNIKILANQCQILVLTALWTHCRCYQKPFELEGQCGVRIKDANCVLCPQSEFAALHLHVFIAHLASRNGWDALKKRVVPFLLHS